MELHVEEAGIERTRMERVILHASEPGSERSSRLVHAWYVFMAACFESAGLEVNGVRAVRRSAFSFNIRGMLLYAASRFDHASSPLSPGARRHKECQDSAWST